MARANRRLIWSIAMAAWSIAGAVRANETAPVPAPSVLYMADGDFYTGTLQDNAAADTISWQSIGAVRPFQFPVGAVRAAFFPAPAQPAPAEAEFCFELAGGDRLYGTLVGLTSEVVEIESPKFGRLHIQRPHVRRILPWLGSNAWEYSGPNGLADWRPSPSKTGWHEEAGHLLSAAPSASLRKQIKIPEKAAIELAISWDKKPDFMFNIAAGADKRLESEGVHFEIWDDTLVLVREAKEDADLATICDLKSVKNRLHLQILIDQVAGKVSVHTLEGKQLGEITFEPKKESPLQWVFLRNHRGDVRLEQIVVSKWSGQPPPQIDTDRERIQMTDGAIIYGDIVRYESESRSFVVREEAGEKTVVAKDVTAVALWTDTKEVPGLIRVGCHDGSRLSGQLASVEGGTISIVRTGIEEPVVFTIADVRCLIGVPGEKQPVKPAQQAARLEMQGVRSHGQLADGKSDEATSCLVWQPRHSTASSPLEHSVSGQIIYRDVPQVAAPSAEELKKQQEAQQQAQRRGGVFGAFVNAFTGPPAPATTPRLSGYPHALFLMAGDRIPCIVSRIDDQGVYFTSSVVESDMIPHAQIKALELVARTAAVTLAEEKRLRLLTLPRMQKNNPPTHLISSTSGDYLRARLQSMDAQTVSAETRLEAKRLPRGRVATIIWLHPPAGDKPEEPAPPAAAPSAMRVQAVRADGVRLTFVPHEFAENAIIGNSDLLGACRVDVKTVDRILLGSRIEEATGETLYDSWALNDAIEPKYVSDDATSAAPAAGLKSSLIGKPAPEVRLEKLDGGKFTLSKQKGHIVVLDFWATWCAPCMQLMPELDRVVAEFKDKNVEYIAVNMQEDRATISATLERMKLDPTVILDIDGAASERYEVSSIPQVVVIDAEGNVARMFIGVNAEFADQMRAALNELLTPAAPAGDTATGQ